MAKGAYMMDSGVAGRREKDSKAGSRGIALKSCWYLQNFVILQLQSGILQCERERQVRQLSSTTRKKRQAEGKKCQVLNTISREKTYIAGRKKQVLRQKITQIHKLPLLVCSHIN